MVSFTDYQTFEKFILQETGCKIFSGIDIRYDSTKKTCILKSTPEEYYYVDSLQDLNNPEYTLRGQIGDQNEGDIINKNLLNPKRTEKIYLFQQVENKWIWYGRYSIKSKTERMHPDKNNNVRKIIVLLLEKYVFIQNTGKIIQLTLADQTKITSTYRNKS